MADMLKVTKVDEPKVGSLEQRKVAQPKKAEAQQTVEQPKELPNIDSMPELQIKIQASRDQFADSWLKGGTEAGKYGDIPVNWVNLQLQSEAIKGGSWEDLYGTIETADPYFKQKYGFSSQYIKDIPNTELKAKYETEWKRYKDWKAGEDAKQQEIVKANIEGQSSYVQSYPGLTTVEGTGATVRSNYAGISKNDPEYNSPRNVAWREQYSKFKDNPVVFTETGTTLDQMNRFYAEALPYLHAQYWKDEIIDPKTRKSLAYGRWAFETNDDGSLTEDSKKLIEVLDKYGQMGQQSLYNVRGQGGFSAGEVSGAISSAMEGGLSQSEAAQLVVRANAGDTAAKTTLANLPSKQLSSDAKQYLSTHEGALQAAKVTGAYGLSGQEISEAMGATPPMPSGQVDIISGKPLAEDYTELQKRIQGIQDRQKYGTAGDLSETDKAILSTVQTHTKDGVIDYSSVQAELQNKLSPDELASREVTEIIYEPAFYEKQNLPQTVTIKIPEGEIASGAVYPESMKVASESGVGGLPRAEGLYYKGGDPKRGIVVEYFIEKGAENIPLTVWYKDPGGIWTPEAFNRSGNRVEIHCTQGLCDFHAADLAEGVRYVIEKGWTSYEAPKVTPTPKVELPKPPEITKPVVIPPEQKLPPPPDIQPQDKYKVPESKDQFLQWKKDFDDAVKKGIIQPVEGIFAGKNENGELIVINKPYYETLSTEEKQEFDQTGIAGIETWKGQNEATQNYFLDQLSSYRDLTDPKKYRIAEFAQDQRDSGNSVENIVNILVAAGFDSKTASDVTTTLPPSNYLSDKQFNSLAVDDYAKYRSSNPNDPRVKYGAQIMPTAMPGDVFPSGLSGATPAYITWAQATKNEGKQGLVAQVSTKIASQYEGLMTQQGVDLVEFGKDIKDSSTPLGSLLNTVDAVKNNIAKTIVAYDPNLKLDKLSDFNPRMVYVPDVSNIQEARHWLENETWTTAQLESYLNQDKADKIRMWTEGKMSTGMGRQQAEQEATQQYEQGDFGTGLLTTVHTAWELAKFIPTTAVVLVDNWVDLAQGDREAIVDTVNLAGGVILFPIHATGGLATKVSSGRYWSAGGELAGYAVGAVVTPHAMAKEAKRGVLNIYDVVQAARGKAVLPRALNFRTDIPLIEVPDVFKTIEALGAEKLNKLYAISDITKQRAEIRKLLNPETAKVYDAQLEVIDKLVDAPVNPSNYAKEIDIAKVVKRLPDHTGAEKVKDKLQEYGSDIIVMGSLSDNVQMEGIKGQYKANDLDIKTYLSREDQAVMAQELADAYGNGTVAKGRKVYDPSGEKIIEIHTVNEFPVVEFGFDSAIKNKPVVIDGIYFEDIRNQIIRRGKESIRPGLGEEGTGLMGIEVSGMEHRGNDVLRYGIIADMLIDNLRKDGKTSEADILQRKLDMVFESPRGEALEATTKGQESPTEVEFINAVDEALRNVITASLDTQKKIEARPLWLKELVDQGSLAVDKALKENAELRQLQQGGDAQAFYRALDKEINKYGVKIYQTGAELLGGQALPIPKNSAQKARIDNAVNILKQESVLPSKVATITQRGTFTRELTPAEKALPLTLYSVVRDGTPYRQAVTEGRPVVAGYLYNEKGELIPAERPEIYLSSQAAFDRAFDLYENKLGADPIVVALEVTTKDLFDVVEPVNRTEILKKPAQFQVVGTGEGNYIEYTVALDEWTAKEGTPIYGLLDANYKLPDIYTRHPRTGDKIPIMYFTTERGLSEGILPPTPQVLRGLVTPALRAGISDLLHPHLAPEVVVSDDFVALGEQPLIDFYRKDWEFVPVDSKRLVQLRAEYANGIFNKTLEDLKRKIQEAPEKPIEPTKAKSVTEEEYAKQLEDYNKQLQEYDAMEKEYQRQQSYLRRVRELTEALESRDKYWGDIRFKENRLQAEKWVKSELQGIGEDLFPGEFKDEFTDQISKDMVKNAWSQYGEGFARVKLTAPKIRTVSQLERTSKLSPKRERTSGGVVTKAKYSPVPSETTGLSTSIGTIPTTSITPVTTVVTTPSIIPTLTPLTTTKPITTPVTTPVLTPSEELLKRKGYPQISPEEKYKELSTRQIEGAVAWKQGWCYKLWYPPYGQGDVINSRKPLPDVKYFKGAGSAAASIIAKQGEIPPHIKRDMGIVDIDVFKGKSMPNSYLGDYNTKPVIKFKADPKQKTKYSGIVTTK